MPYMPERNICGTAAALEGFQMHSEWVVQQGSISNVLCYGNGIEIVVTAIEGHDGPESWVKFMVRPASFLTFLLRATLTTDTALMGFAIGID
jgi:hypothetical protein